MKQLPFTISESLNKLLAWKENFDNRLDTSSDGAQGTLHGNFDATISS